MTHQRIVHETARNMRDSCASLLQKVIDRADECDRKVVTIELLRHVVGSMKSLPLPEKS